MASQTRNDIQGLRALAVILVILFHLPTVISLRGGFIGVDIFFVISGFVVTRMVVLPGSLVAGAWSRIGRFLGRRVMRLVPALSVVVIVTLLVGFLVASPAEFAGVSQAGLSSEAFVSNLYYASNFDTYWDPAILRSPFLHTWSLGVEFQTYLVFPLVFIGVFRARMPRGRALTGALWAVVVMSLISFAIFLWLLLIRETPLHGFDPKALAFYTPVTRFWEFGLGMIPAILSVRDNWSLRRPVRFASGVAWLLILAGVITSTVADALNPFVILSCLGVAILLANGERAPHTRRSFLEWGPLVWIGDRSYSIYLWHWPMLVVALWLFPGNVPVATGSVAVTVGLSMLSYRLVEQRFRRTNGRSVARSLLPSVAFIVAGLMVAGGSINVSAASWFVSPIPLSRAASAFTDPSSPTGTDMDAAMAGCVYEALEVHCVNFDRTVPEVIVIGDSLGSRAFPAVQLAAKQHGLNASMLWTGGCSIELDSCPQFIYDYLGKANVAAIFVDTNFDRASNLQNGNEKAAGLAPACPVSQSVVRCPAHRAAVADFDAKAPAGLRQLDSYTDHLLVALPFPQQSTLVQACLAPPIIERVVDSKVDPTRCGQTSLKWQKERQGLFPTAITAAVTTDPRATLWDPTKYLCQAGRCPAVINGGEQIMDDAVHWSGHASRFLYPEFSSYLDGIAAR